MPSLCITFSRLCSKSSHVSNRLYFHGTASAHKAILGLRVAIVLPLYTTYTSTTEHTRYIRYTTDTSIVQDSRKM